MLSNGARARRATARQKDGFVEDFLPMSKDATPKKNRKRRRRGRMMIRTRSRVVTIAGLCVLAVSAWVGWRIWATKMVQQTPSVGSAPVDNSSMLEPPAILIIGGTDGSGTRAFCTALESLGVDMIVDDVHTMDVAASQLFQRTGWPGLVKFVMNETRGSVDYKWDDLSPTAQRILRHEVKKFCKHLWLAHQNLERKKDKLEKVLIPHATKIKFAIKAPASMLVFPVLKHVFEKELDSPVKFLHIVRDGRDMSLSQNQSPVEKFYNVTYPNDYKERSAKWDGELYNVRAMQLWNDWNLEVMKNHRGSRDYMLARSEDLLNKRWQIMQALHKLVGSTMSMEKLCCQSQKKSRDMGESVKFVKAAPGRKHRQGRTNAELQRSLATYQHFQKLSFADWTKTVDQTIQSKEEENSDPRAAAGAHLAETLEALLARGKSIDPETLQNDESDNFLLKMQKLEGMAVHEFEKEFRAWKTKMNLRDRSATEGQNQFLLNTGKSLLDRSFMLISSTKGRYATILRQDGQYVFKGPHIRELSSEIKKLMAPLGTGANKEDTGKIPIEQRYGKWQELLENRDDLSKHLFEEGALGLKEFGYEPYREVEYPMLDFSCSQEQILQCSDHDISASTPLEIDALA